jgi:hypothetical protein
MRSFLFFVLLIVSLSGCGGDKGPALGQVKGKVTFFGKPYTKGIVTFTPSGGGPGGISQTDANGEYDIWTNGKRGAVVGSHKVSVTTVVEATSEAPSGTETSSDNAAYESQASGQDMSAYKQAEKKKEPIAAKYNKNTELTFEVKSGESEYNIDIK